MADGLQVTEGTGPRVATDERTIASVVQHVHRTEEIGSTSVASGQVNVTNTSTTIVAARETRSRLILVNRQTVPVFIEMTTATAADFRLDPGDSIVLYATCEVDGITSAAYTGAGDALVHYIEEYD
jgi:hypothetical protein